MSASEVADFRANALSVNTRASIYAGSVGGSDDAAALPPSRAAAVRLGAGADARTARVTLLVDGVGGRGALQGVSRSTSRGTTSRSSSPKGGRALSHPAPSHRDVRVLATGALSATAGALRRPDAAAAAVAGYGAGLLGVPPFSFLTVPELLTPPHATSLDAVGAAFAPAVAGARGGDDDGALAASSGSTSASGRPWIPALVRALEKETPFPPPAREALVAAENAWLSSRIERIAELDALVVRDPRPPAEIDAVAGLGVRAAAARDAVAQASAAGGLAHLLALSK